MKYGLTDEQWNKIKSVMVANPRVSRVLLYGSRAKGNYKPLLPYQFDISIFHQLKNDTLIDHINRRGIVIYEKSDR